MDDVDAAEKLAAHQGRKSVGGIALRAVSTQVAEGPGYPCGTFHTAFQSEYVHEHNCCTSLVSQQRPSCRHCAT